MGSQSGWVQGFERAHVLAPTTATHQRLAGALRATTVMASPLVNHLVSDWFENANGQEVLSAIREECRWRSDQIRARLTPYGVRTQTNGFHAWLPLPVPEDGACMASDMASELRSLGVAAVAGSTFSTDRNPPEGLRICLGGALTRDDCGRALQAVVDSLENCAFRKMAD